MLSKGNLTMKTTLKLTALIAALISATAFAGEPTRSSANEPAAVDFKYGMHLKIDRVVSRTDNSQKEGVVPAELVYLGKDGKLHKVRFLELGGRTSQNS
jgi:hypothetical protein